MKIKKFVALIMLVMLSVLVGTAGGTITAFAATETLVIYNWAEYICEDDEDGLIEVISAFEDYYKAKYGVTLKVEYNTFETNEEVVTKVLLGDSNIDLLCPSEYSIQKLMEAGALLKIDTSSIENYGNLDTEVLEKIEEEFGEVSIGDGTTASMLEYIIPYTIGTLGILYNADVVTEEDIATGWGILWNEANNPLLNSKIYVKDSVRDTYVAAVMYAKEQGLLPEEYASLSASELINTTDDTMLEIVEDVLIAQQSVLRGYEVDQGKDEMIQEKAYVCLSWSGDALYAIEDAENYGINLDYYTPEIGGNIFYDGFVRTTSSTNERASMEFLNFLCEPEVAMSNMLYIGYTSTLDKEVFLSSEACIAMVEEMGYDIDEFFENISRYPDIQDDTFGIMRDFGDNNDAVVMMWENIKPSETDTLIIILGVMVGIFVIGGVAYMAFKRFSGNRVYH